MRSTKFVFVASAGAFLGFVAIAGVANATDIDQAIEMCEDRGPDCVHYYDGDGHEVIVVDNGDNGKQTIICSHQSRDCVAARRPPRVSRNRRTFEFRQSAVVSPSVERAPQRN